MLGPPPRGLVAAVHAEPGVNMAFVTNFSRYLGRTSAAAAGTELDGVTQDGLCGFPKSEAAV